MHKDGFSRLYVCIHIHIIGTCHDMGTYTSRVNYRNRLVATLLPLCQPWTTLTICIIMNDIDNMQDSLLLDSIVLSFARWYTRLVASVASIHCRIREPFSQEIAIGSVSVPCKINISTDALRKMSRRDQQCKNVVIGTWNAYCEADVSLGPVWIIVLYGRSFPMMPFLQQWREMHCPLQCWCKLDPTVRKGSSIGLAAPAD